MKPNSVQTNRLIETAIDSCVNVEEGHGWDMLVERRNRPSVYLYPGAAFVSDTPASVTTILGSCVAVCMWDAALGIGGANHFLLPYGRDEDEPSLRFGDVAVKYLIERLISLGCSRNSLQAKLFGGANVIKAFSGADDLLGLQNAETARRLLAQFGIPIVKQDLGGSQGRKIIFHVDSGRAWVKRL